jgi:hypothetical protein
MGMQALTVELAFVKAWQTCCAMGGAAGNQEQLRGRLQRYLNSRYTADSGSSLCIDGLAFLKRSSAQRSGKRRSGKRRSVSA